MTTVSFRRKLGNPPTRKVRSHKEVARGIKEKEKNKAIEIAKGKIQVEHPFLCLGTMVAAIKPIEHVGPKEEMHKANEERGLEEKVLDSHEGA